MRKQDSPFYDCPLPFPSTEWRGVITRGIDGDTIVMSLDHGFFATLDPIEFRFASIDAWEDNDTPKQTAAQTALGIKAREEVKNVCEHRWAYVVTHMDTEKYGRILGDPYVWQEDGSLLDVCEHLHSLGLVKTWQREARGVARLSNARVIDHHNRSGR